MTQLIFAGEPRPAAQVPVESGSISAQGIRFFLIGSGGTLLQLALYAVSAQLIGAQLASIASWLMSTLVTNSAHRAVTFGVRGAARNRSDQLAAFVTCLVGLLITSIVLAELPDADGTSGLVAILVVNTVVGAARFFGLRWWLSPSGRRVASHLGLALHAGRDSWHAPRSLSGLHH